jgi:hypothetical protein
MRRQKCGLHLYEKTTQSKQSPDGRILGANSSNLVTLLARKSEIKRRGGGGGIHSFSSVALNWCNGHGDV